MYVTEHVIFKYPQIPADVVKTVVEAYCGNDALAKVGTQLGVQFIMRYKSESPSTSGPPAVKSWVVNSLIGAAYMEKGALETKKWIKDHILPRAVDVEEHVNLHIKMKRPRQLLSFITKSQNKPSPVARYPILIQID
jgi:dsRNA-specific ribonuclease